MRFSVLLFIYLLNPVAAFSPARPSHQRSTALSVEVGAISSVADIPQETILAAGAAAVAGFVGVFTNSNGEESSSSTSTSEPEPEPIDVSIPYNAAAILAFKEMKGSSSFKQAEFDEFEALYEAKVVAEVTAKKVQRDAQETVNKAEAAASKAAAELEKKFS